MTFLYMSPGIVPRCGYKIRANLDNVLANSNKIAMVKKHRVAKIYIPVYCDLDSFLVGTYRYFSL